jgi:hypothetical protein
LIHPAIRGYENLVVEYVNDKVKTLKDNRHELEERWMLCVEAYASKFSNATWVAAAKADNRSTRYVALTWDAVQNIVAQMMTMLFPNDQWFSVEPGRRGGFVMSDDLDAPKIEHLLRYQHGEMQFRSKMRRMLTWLVITGNCPWAMYWSKDSAADYPAYSAAMAKWVQRQADITAAYNTALDQYAQQTLEARALGVPSDGPAPQRPAEGEMPTGSSSLIYEGPKLVIGDPFNFVMDDCANDDLTAFRAANTWRSIAYLRHLQQVDETGYTVYENLEDVQNSGGHKADHFSRNPALALAFGMVLPTKSSVSLVEGCGDMELNLGAADGNGQYIRSWTAVVANNNTLLKCEPTHLWRQEPHLQLARLIDMPGQVYGGGLVENALGLVDATNVRLNQIIDASAVAINPETKVYDDGVYDPENAESGPGAQHIVGDINNLQPLHKDLQGLSLSFTEIGLLTSMVQQMFRSPNASANTRGDSSATRTARDTSVMGGSLQDMARYVEDNALMPILDMQLQHNQQYLDEDIVVKIVQEGMSEWHTVGPDVVQRRWKNRITGSANQMLREKRLQDLMTFLQVVGGNPMLSQAARIDFSYLLKRVYEEMGFSDGDKTFPAMPQMGPMSPGGMGGGGGILAPGGVPGDQGDQGFPGAGPPNGPPPGVA